MNLVRSVAVIAVIFVGWSFSPYLEYLHERPSQANFGGREKMGLFTSNDGVERSGEVLEEINQRRTVPIDVKIYPGMGHGLFDQSGWISQDYLSFMAGWIQDTNATALSKLDQTINEES